MDSSSQTIKKNRFKGGLHGRIFLKINTTFNPLMLDVNEKVKLT